METQKDVNLGKNHNFTEVYFDKIEKIVYIQIEIGKRTKITEVNKNDFILYRMY